MKLHKHIRPIAFASVVDLGNPVQHQTTARKNNSKNGKIIQFIKMKENSHSLNEDLKRLEPTDTQCAFCKEGKVINIDSCLYAPVYNIRDRTFLVVYRSVKFSQVLVGIPRCYNCRNKHQGTREKPVFFAIILSIALWIFLGIQYDILGWFIGGFTAVPLVGLILYFVIKNYLENNNGIPTETEGAKKDDTVQELLQADWSLQKPRA